MRTLSIEDQKKAILYAPKDLLWEIIEADSAWLKIFYVLPPEYLKSFLGALRRSAVDTSNKDKLRAHAETYVRHKVRHDHLQEALVQVWNPEDLEEATSWLKEKGFLGRPLMPLNLQAAKDVIRKAKATPLATRERYARSAGGKGPKANQPPDNASKEGAKLWRRVLRDAKRRRIILKPKNVGDQWSLAVKFWLQECAQSKCQAYKSNAGRSSKSMHANNVIGRAIQELANGMEYEGYSMSRPASRKLKALWRQLEKDGVDMGKWKSIRPKKRM